MDKARGAPGSAAGPKRKRGRPRKGDSPRFPWTEIEREYVFGERVVEKHDGSFERRFPSIGELAKKYGIVRSLVGYHSKRQNWAKQRRDYQNELTLEIRRAAATARGFSTQDGLGILDRYLEKFREAVESGHVRVDSITDFNTAMRLREFLQGGAESRQEIQGALTLEEMQARHRRLREAVAALDANLAGVVVREEPDAAEPVEVDAVVERAEAADAAEKAEAAS